MSVFTLPQTFALHFLSLPPYVSVYPTPDLRTSFSFSTSICQCLPYPRPSHFIFFLYLHMSVFTLPQTFALHFLSLPPYVSVYPTPDLRTSFSFSTSICQCLPFPRPSHFIFFLYLHMSVFTLPQTFALHFLSLPPYVSVYPTPDLRTSLSFHFRLSQLFHSSFVIYYIQPIL